MRVDHVILRLRWLLGDTLTILIIHALGKIRPFLGLTAIGGREEQDWVIENISGEASNILDLGASESLLRLHLRNTQHSVFCADIRFIRGIDSKPFVLADAMSLPFREGVFDYVVLGSAIEHIGLGIYNDPIAQNGDLMTMREVKRVLRKGGHVIITTPYSTGGGVTWQKYYSNAMIERLAKGFVIVKKEYLLRTNTPLKRPWKRIKDSMQMPIIEITDSPQAIICAVFQKI